MKIRIHMLGNINLICEAESVETLVRAQCPYNDKDLLEISYAGLTSKYINPTHIVAIEEYVEPGVAPESRDSPEV